MANVLSKFAGLLVALSLTLGAVSVFANGSTSDTEPTSPTDASFKSRCTKVPAGFPPCADAPSECGSNTDTGNTPFNCVFIEEPIGGRPGYDLYKRDCHPNAGQTQPSGEGGQATNLRDICDTTLWYGEAIIGTEEGPFQAILAYEPGKEFQGPFGLLYGYLGLVYNFMSGIIVAFVVLVSIIGGIRMSTSAGNQEAFSSGKKMIIKALVGMVIWFTASVILYTINPTFFAF